MTNQPSPRNLLRWFDPRHRQTGTWAFILNRITALGLTLYLAMHLIVLGRLAQGPDAYDSFVALAHSPLVKIGEMLVITAGILHGLNGLRVVITSLGIAVRYQKELFWTLILLSGFLILIFARAMFFGGQQ